MPRRRCCLQPPDDVNGKQIFGAVIDSPVMGKITPMALSGGAKTLILMKNERSKVFNTGKTALVV